MVKKCKPSLCAWVTATAVVIGIIFFIAGIVWFGRWFGGIFHEPNPPEFTLENALISDVELRPQDNRFTAAFHFTLKPYNPYKNGTTLIYGFNTTSVEVGFYYPIFFIGVDGTEYRHRPYEGYVDLASTSAAMVPPFNQSSGNVTTLPLVLQANDLTLDGNATTAIQQQMNVSNAVNATVTVTAAIQIQKGAGSNPRSQGLLVKCVVTFPYGAVQQSGFNETQKCDSHLCEDSKLSCPEEAV